MTETLYGYVCHVDKYDYLHIKLKPKDFDSLKHDDDTLIKISQYHNPPIVCDYYKVKIPDKHKEYYLEKIKQLNNLYVAIQINTKKWRMNGKEGTSFHLVDLTQAILKRDKIIVT